MTEAALQLQPFNAGVDDPVKLNAIMELLAPALSQGRRHKARLVTGPERAFFCSKNCRQVYIPFPLGDLDNAIQADNIAPLRMASCGLALQASPSKESVMQLPLQDLKPKELIALTLVEGEVAMAWVIQQWPGLAAELRQLLPEITPNFKVFSDRVINGRVLVNEALRRVRHKEGQHTELPALLGQLPMDERLRKSLSSLFRGKGRMPYSFRKVQPVKTLFAIPVGGSGGVRSKNIPPPSNPDEDDDLEIRPQRKVGIPYDEWNMHTLRYRRDHVSVIERHAPVPLSALDAIRSSTLAAPPADVMRWFQLSPTLSWHQRLEDGSDLDVDAYINQYSAIVAGEETDGRIYRGLKHGERDVATAILLDGSASLGADGGLHQKLQLACADALISSLSLARERHGVFAFTGNTRHRVEVSVLKDFNEPHAIMPGRTGLLTAGYTRLGAPLRHITRRLLDVPAERRILLSLGDGLPSDEGYEGRYAWADVAKAVEEAGNAGVIVYHIGVGRVSIDPLKACFGPERSQRVSSLRDLPHVLAQVHTALCEQ